MPFIDLNSGLGESFGACVMGDGAAVAIPCVVSMPENLEVVSINGKRPPITIDSVCVHGDNPAAVAMAAGIRKATAAPTLQPMTHGS